MNNKNCQKCNKEFSKKVTCSKKEWINCKFCSHSCANSVNMKGKQHTLGKIPWNKGIKTDYKKVNLYSCFCLQCKAIYQVEKHRLTRTKFCSTLCRTNYSNHGKTPENKRIRESKAYKAWRTLVFERDNYTCQECRVVGGYLHADHIKPFAYFPELRLDIDNGRTLCVPCHRKTPTYGVGAWRKLVGFAQET